MKIKNKKNHCQNRISRKSANIKKLWRGGLFVFTVAIVLVYLFQVNCLAITGFEIKELEREIYSLQETNKDLTLTVTQLHSINNLEKISQDLSMVRIDGADYIDYQVDSVALNK